MQLFQPKTPLLTEELILKQRGCAKIGSDDLMIDAEWKAVKVEAFLRRCFPVLFDYMDNERVYQKCSHRWYLLSKQKGRLTIVPTQPITGTKLKRFRGREGAPI